MAMNWLKGLVAPAAQFVQQGAQPVQPGASDPNVPPVGGSPMPGTSPYGVPQGMPVQQQPAPMDMAGGYQPMQWSTGTRTQGQAQQGVPGSVGSAQSLEQRVGELQHNVDSLALFARTLLTMLEEQKVVTRAQFEETKNRLDALDGKIDDR